MKRKIKFRARWRDTGKVIPDFQDEYMLDAVNDDLFIVDQFTGLKDKNGVEIYEGDILSVTTFGFNSEHFVASVEWSRIGYKLSNGRNMLYHRQSDYTVMDDAVIIGNIHDNPDLLK